MRIILFGMFRSRLTSTGEDEREYQSEHETSWDEFEDRYENFSAGRERLQEFNGRIPPRKKKKDLPKPKSEKKVPNLHRKLYLPGFFAFLIKFFVAIKFTSFLRKIVLCLLVKRKLYNSTVPLCILFFSNLIC